MNLCKLFENVSNDNMRTWSDGQLCVNIIDNQDEKYFAEIIAISYNNNIITHICQYANSCHDKDDLFSIVVDDDENSTLHYDGKYIDDLPCESVNLYVSKDYIVITNCGQIMTVYKYNLHHGIKYSCV